MGAGGGGGGASAAATALPDAMSRRGSSRGPGAALAGRTRLVELRAPTATSMKQRILMSILSLFLSYSRAPYTRWIARTSTMTAVPGWQKPIGTSPLARRHNGVVRSKAGSPLSCRDSAMLLIPPGRMQPKNSLVEPLNLVSGCPTDKASNYRCADQRRIPYTPLL